MTGNWRLRLESTWRFIQKTDVRLAGLTVKRLLVWKMLTREGSDGMEETVGMKEKNGIEVEILIISGDNLLIETEKATYDLNRFINKLSNHY